MIFFFMPPFLQSPYIITNITLTVITIFDFFCGSEISTFSSDYRLPASFLPASVMQTFYLSAGYRGLPVPVSYTHLWSLSFSSREPIYISTSGCASCMAFTPSGAAIMQRKRIFLQPLSFSIWIAAIEEPVSYTHLR